MTYDEAIMQAELIKELEAKKDRIQDWIDGLKDGLKEFLSAQGESSMLLGTHKVSYTEFTTHHFDSKKFKDEHNELYRQYEVASTVKRFSIN